MKLWTDLEKNKQDSARNTIQILWIVKKESA